MQEKRQSNIALSRAQQKQIFWTRLTQWEYWPMWLVHLPMFWLYPILALKRRALLFFSAANPNIETGGMLGEAKSDIFELTPDEYQPAWVLLQANASKTDIEQAIQKVGLPLVAKPNRGERGRLIKICKTKDDVFKHLEAHQVDFVLQAFAKGSCEASIMVARDPHTNQCTITSVTLKQFLSVIGDGKQTVDELMTQSPRALMQLERLRKHKPELLQSIPEKDQEIIIEQIGNHSRGTMFLDGNYLINDQMTSVFAQIIKQMNGVFYGRFDLRCTNLDSLQTGVGIEIVEFNGVGAEPAHIYQPGYSLFRAWWHIIRHWLTISSIAKANHKNGVTYMTLKQGKQHLDMLKEYNAQANA